MRKKFAKKLLIELLRDSKQSDRALAKKLGVSQPTITRTRSELEREGYIKHYTFIPDMRKIGLEILAFTFVKMDPTVLTEELIDKVREYAAKFPNGIFASTGEGMGMTGVIVGVHKDYRDYAKKLAMFRSDWGEYLEDIQSFVMATEEGVIKDFSFKYLDEKVLGSL
jgi:DNA-binding Lrp family transcriptional regulator